MNFAEWYEKYKPDLKMYHGNVGNADGICIERSDGNGWIFWGNKGIENIPESLFE